MYERILVALDGSDLAERVLPHVEELASKLGSSVIAFQAIVPAETIMAETATGFTGMAAAGPAVDPTPIIEAERSTAAEYLGRIAGRLRGRGLNVEAEIAEGNASDAIVEAARSHNANLIAMTTHGRSGLGRLVFGSVAEGVLHHAPCPVLLVRTRDKE